MLRRLHCTAQARKLSPPLPAACVFARFLPPPQDFTIRNASTLLDGGCVHSYRSLRYSIARAHISLCRVGDYGTGGAVSQEWESLTITDAVIEDAVGNYGGGIGQWGSTGITAVGLTVRNCTVCLCTHQATQTPTQLPTPER